MHITEHTAFQHMHITEHTAFQHMHITEHTAFQHMHITKTLPFSTCAPYWINLFPMHAHYLNSPLSNNPTTL